MKNDFSLSSEKPNLYYSRLPFEIRSSRNKHILDRLKTSCLLERTFLARVNKPIP